MSIKWSIEFYTVLVVPASIDKKSLYFSKPRHRSKFNALTEEATHKMKHNFQVRSKSNPEYLATLFNKNSGTVFQIASLVVHQGDRCALRLQYLH